MALWSSGMILALGYQRCERPRVRVAAGPHFFFFLFFFFFALDMLYIFYLAGCGLLMVAVVNS